MTNTTSLSEGLTHCYEILDAHVALITSISWSPDGKLLAAASDSGNVKIWSKDSFKLIWEGQLHSEPITSLNWINTNTLVTSGEDYQLQLFDLRLKRSFLIDDDFSSTPYCMDVGIGASKLAIGLENGYIIIHDLNKHLRLHEKEAHSEYISEVKWSPGGDFLATCSGDRRIRIWRYPGMKLQTTIRGRYGDVNTIDWSKDGEKIVIGCEDATIRIIDVKTKKEEYVIEGHLKYVRSAAYSPNSAIIVSKSKDSTVKFWSSENLELLASIEEVSSGIPGGVSFSPVDPILATRNDKTNSINIWSINYEDLLQVYTDRKSVHYTTAKIALVGDTGVGKTGLGWRLINGHFKEQSSTHGQQFWVFGELNQLRDDGTECEAVLWDFAGQPDYRLVHSLFLDDVDLALLLFDPSNREKPLKGVDFWLKQLQYGKNPNAKILLVGARCDRGTLTLSPQEIDEFAARNKIEGYISTSAMTGEGIDELLTTIKVMIDWSKIPATVTNTTFKKIKECVLSIKSKNPEAVVSVEKLEEFIRDADPLASFTLEEMNKAVSHLETHGFVSRLRRSNGELAVLLSPDKLIQLASSVILEARKNPTGLGSLEEDRLLSNSYDFKELYGLKDTDQEVLVDAVTTLFLQHNLCFRESFNETVYLVFPSLVNERPPLASQGDTVEDVFYKITGSFEKVYPSLVVSLGYTNLFTYRNQWRNQSEYIIDNIHKCGIKLIDDIEGEIDVIIYYSAKVPQECKNLFQGLVERFLKKHDVEITRYASLECKACNYVQDRAIILKQIQRKKHLLHCVDCGNKLVIPSPDKIIALHREEIMIVDHEQALSSRRTAYEAALVWIKSRVRTEVASERKSVFVSYAWGVTQHEKWVLKLAHDLKNADIDVVFDKWHNIPGTSVSKFVEKIDGCNFVLPVGTPLYLEKYDSKVSDPVVDAEIRLINTLIRKKQQSERVIPILLDGTQETSFPPMFIDSVFIDFREPDLYFMKLFDLLLVINSVPRDIPGLDDIFDQLKFGITK